MNRVEYIRKIYLGIQEYKKKNGITHQLPIESKVISRGIDARNEEALNLIKEIL